MDSGHTPTASSHMTQARVGVMLLVLILPFNSISCIELTPTEAPNIARRLENRDSDKARRLTG